MYICTKVLSSVFNYRTWLPNSVVPVSWQELIRNEYFLFKSLYVSLFKWFSC